MSVVQDMLLPQQLPRGDQRLLLLARPVAVSHISLAAIISKSLQHAALDCGLQICKLHDLSCD